MLKLVHTPIQHFFLFFIPAKISWSWAASSGKPGSVQGQQIRSQQDLCLEMQSNILKKRKNNINMSVLSRKLLRIQRNVNNVSRTKNF